MMFAGILAKPVLIALVALVLSAAGAVAWFSSKYVSEAEYQALAANLQEAQKERNLAEVRLKRQAEEFTERLTQNRRLWQEKEAANQQLQRHMDSWRERFMEIDQDDEVRSARATPVPASIVLRLRVLAEPGGGEQ